MIISQEFISQLFQNQHFVSQLNIFIHTHQPHIIHPLIPSQQQQIQQIIQQITQQLFSNNKISFQKQYTNLYQSNKFIMKQIEKIKGQIKFIKGDNQNNYCFDYNNINTIDVIDGINDNLRSINRFNTQTSTTFCEQYQLQNYQTKHYQMEQGQFQSNNNNNKNNNNNNNNSIFFDHNNNQQQQYFNQSNYNYSIMKLQTSQMQNKLNGLELSLQNKFQKYTIKIQKIIEQFRKTIASVVEEMNDRCQYVAVKGKQQQEQKSNKQICQHNKKVTKQQKTPTNHAQHKPNNHKKPSYDIFFTPVSLQKTLSINNNNSKSSIQSLNKSFNFGRSKIKSLLFGSSQKNKINPENKI